jgi:hypothetical protein
MADRHKTTPKAVRMPDGLLARVETAAEADGGSVNAFIVAAIEERLQRREGGSTPEPVDCPHPKARVHKGLCGACGTNVGAQG